MIKNYSIIVLIRKGDTIWPAAHFFWGYSVTLTIFLFLLWVITRKVNVSDLRAFLKKRAVVGVFGGFWAMIPDINYFIKEPAFHNTQLSDVFFFHYTFDQVLPETDLFFAAEIFLIFMAVNLFAVALSVESFKRLKVALFGKEKEEEDDEEVKDGDDDKEGEKEEGEEDDEEDGNKEGDDRKDKEDPSVEASEVVEDIPEEKD